MKKFLLLALLAAGVSLMYSCGGKGGSGSSAGSEAAASGTLAASKRMQETFGDKLFWGVSSKSTEADIKALRISGSETNHDDVSYQWSKTLDSGGDWVFDVYFDEGSLESYSFAYTGSSRSDAEDFSDELLEALKAAYGSGSSSSAAHDWEDGPFALSLLKPDPDDKSDKLVMFNGSRME